MIGFNHFHRFGFLTVLTIVRIFLATKNFFSSRVACMDIAQLENNKYSVLVPLNSESVKAE